MAIDFILKLNAAGRTTVIQVDTRIQPLRTAGSGAAWRQVEGDGWDAARGVAAFWRDATLHLFTSDFIPIAILEPLTRDVREGDSGRGMSILGSGTFPTGPFAWTCLSCNR